LEEWVRACQSPHEPGSQPRNYGLCEESASAWRLIKEAMEAGAIFPVDEDAPKKLMKYVPWWAAARPSGATEA
jgi:hypothetical protein